MERNNCCDLEKLTWIVAQSGSGIDYPIEISQCEICKTCYHRKSGSKIIYVQTGIEDFNCFACGTEIIAAKVAHPIHDGPFPQSGSGKCFYEYVPCCPKCEGAPAYHGTPISG